jgi:hypothetical protein
MFYKLAGDFKDSDYDFIIKLHPFDKITFYTHIQQDYKDNVTITRDDIAQIMKNSYVSITLNSTAIFESVIYHAIPIQIYTDGIARFEDYSSTGLTLLCSGYDQLKKTFNRLISDDIYADDIRRQSLNSLMGNHLANVGYSKQFITEYIMSTPGPNGNSDVS